MTVPDEHIQFGPYLIVRLSGAGGMGRVEVALRVDEKDPDVCVIKRLHGALHDEENEARFRREAQIAARLEHENIARTLRIEKIDGELCIVQEFIEGVNLGKVMRQLGARPLPIVVAVHVVSAVARALAHAHGFGRLGIVHRDVTPENVMLSFAGDVKLIDFGAARSAVDGRVTDTGVVVGRRSYVPPEAWEGEKVDHRADVFALGVVLWEVLTGRRAEEAPDPSLPDASALNPDVTLLLGQVVARAMAPAPEDRYQSADEVAAALAAFIPPEADPRRDLADLLGLCFNVTLQKQLLADDIAEAKQFLHHQHVVTLPLPSLSDLPPPADETLPLPEPAPRVAVPPLQPATRAEATVPTLQPATRAEATVPTPLVANAADSDGADCPDSRRTNDAAAPVRGWRPPWPPSWRPPGSGSFARTAGRRARARRRRRWSWRRRPRPRPQRRLHQHLRGPPRRRCATRPSRPQPRRRPSPRAFRQPTTHAGSPAVPRSRPIQSTGHRTTPPGQVAPPGQRSVGAREHARGLRAGAPGRGGRRRSPRARPARGAAHQHEELRRGGAGAGHRRASRSPQRRGAQNVGAPRSDRSRASRRNNPDVIRRRR